MKLEKIKRRGFLGVLAAAATATGVASPAVASVVKVAPIENPDSPSYWVRALWGRPAAGASESGPGSASLAPSIERFAEDRRRVAEAIANMQVRSIELSWAFGRPAILAIYHGECRGRPLYPFEEAGFIFSATVTECPPGYCATDVGRMICGREYERVICGPNRRTFTVEWRFP